MPIFQKEKHGEMNLQVKGHQSTANANKDEGYNEHFQ